MIILESAIILIFYSIIKLIQQCGDVMNVQSINNQSLIYQHNVETFLMSSIYKLKSIGQYKYLLYLKVN